MAVGYNRGLAIGQAGLDRIRIFHDEFHTLNLRNRGDLPRRVAEAIVLGMACLAPWAFGSVEAWAQLGLFAGTAVVAILVAIADGTASRGRRWLCLPSLGLAGLVLLALFQAAPLPGGMLRWVSPGSASMRADLLPTAPERVWGDPEPPVPLPSPRLSQDPDATIQMAACLAATWLLFQGVVGLGGGASVVRRLAIACSCNATLLALFSIVQALTWNGRIYWVRSSPSSDGWSTGGPFVCHTHLAEYLNMGLGLTLGLVVPGDWRDLLRGRTYRLWAVYAAVIIVAGIVASNSRGGFLAMLASGMVLALLLRKQAFRLGLGAVAILAMVVVVLAALGDASPYLRRIATIVDPTDNGYMIRMEAWRGALRAWSDYPSWGTGLGSFPEAIVPYLEKDRGNFFSRAENEYVDLLAEGGLVGVFLMLVAAIGVARLARRALIAASTPQDRGLVLGSIFGVLALGFNALSDFGPHVPGVGVLAIILIATLCRMGLAAGGMPEDRSISSRASARIGWAFAGVATTALGLALIALGWTNARVEALLIDANLPVPGESTPAMNDFGRTDLQRERQRKALVAVLRLRPGWTDGHIRLGMLHLTLYERMAAEWLRDSGATDSARAADPLWLFGVVHDAARRGSIPISGTALLEHDPVRLHLVPAARSFLEARRSCLVSPIAHVELASLDYLLDGGDPVSIYLVRTLRLAGNGAATLTFAAEVAARMGDARLAARCWKRTLEVGPGGWAEVADAASSILTPEQILDVVPSGQLAFQIAERLYPDAGSRPSRERFLRKAARMLPDDRDLTAAERLQLEARAWAGLDESEKARERMEAALALEPRRDAWRKDLIDWLVRWEKFDEAHAQARVWLYFTPDSKAAQESLDSTADALSRHGSKP